MSATKRSGDRAVILRFEGRAPKPADGARQTGVIDVPYPGRWRVETRPGPGGRMTLALDWIGPALHVRG